MHTQPNQKTPSYRLHRSTGQAVVTIAGRDHYLGVHGTVQSRDAYDRLIAEWLANGRMLKQQAVGGLTVAELAAAYWHFCESYYVKDGAPTSELERIQAALRPVRRLYARSPVAGFGPLALKSIREEYVTAGITRRSVNNQMGRTKRMFRWGVENELVPPSVYHGLQAVGGLRKGRTSAPDREPIGPVPDEYIDAIKPHVAKQVWAIIELQRLTGMRSGEALIMHGCDIDMTGELWLYTPPSHKTEHHGHSRAIELGPKAQAAIKPFLKQNLQAFLFSPADAVADRKIEKRNRRKSKVQASQRDRSKPNPKRKHGDRYTTDSYRRAIECGCEKAWPVPKEIEKDAEKVKAWRRVHSWHPHQLRHNYATRIRKEYGVEAARILLGHRSAVVTELYAEIDRGRVRDIVAKVG